MSRHTARVSRAGLILIGLILLAGAGTVLARSLDTFPAALGRANVPLLSRAQVRYPTEHAWVWPAAAAAAAVIALLALWWLVAQTRTNTVRRLSLEPDRTHGATVLPADAAIGAITDELASWHGVHQANAALRGPPAAPDLQLSVTVDDRDDPAILRTRIETEALTHLRSALELGTILTVMRIRFVPANDRYVA